MMLGTLPICLALSCGRAPAATTTEPVRIWAALAPDLVTAMAESYSRRIPGFQFSRQSVVRTSEVVSGVARHKEIGLAQSDVAYIAFRRGTESEPYPHENLRGIAVLWVNYALILVRRDSSIVEVSDLRGKHIGVLTRGTSSEFIARSILAANGLTYNDVHVTFGASLERLRKGEYDAWFNVYPTIDSQVRSDHGAGLRLLPVRRPAVRALQRDYPFLRGVALQPREPETRLEGVETVGADLILLCNKDVYDDLVYQLTSEFFRELPSLAKRFPEAALIDIERAPTTPIPLHPGAARYYREREILR